MTEQRVQGAARDVRKGGVSVLGEILEHPTEVVTAVSLAIAALLTSWSAYHAAIWDGVETAQFTRAEALRTQSAQLATRAGQLQGYDVFVLGQWLNAYATGNQQLQAFYRARFRPELKPAFAAWLATRPLTNPAAPSTPFAMPQYQLAITAQSQELARQADEVFARGEEAKRHSNAFIQITVVLASAMFFGGIVQVFKVRQVRFALMAVSVLTCLWAVLRVISLPVS